jgi:hypothetical protein
VGRHYRVQSAPLVSLHAGCRGCRGTRATRARAGCRVEFGPVSRGLLGLNDLVAAPDTAALAVFSMCHAELGSGFDPIHCHAYQFATHLPTIPQYRRAVGSAGLVLVFTSRVGRPSVTIGWHADPVQLRSTKQLTGDQYPSCSCKSVGASDIELGFIGRQSGTPHVFRGTPKLLFHRTAVMPSGRVLTN